ncbi:hypothetical protein JYT20_01705 [Rhodothermus sp. AH-315-K08]|nr:hypothetical protein [Rhodothermus sp. AH-315-K08]
MSGLEVARELARAEGETKLLPLSSYVDPDYILGTLESGAHGYLTKDESLSTIVTATWTVLNGGVYVGSRVSMGVVAKRTARVARELPGVDTERTLFALGLSPCRSWTQPPQPTHIQILIRSISFLRTALSV